MAQLYEFNKGSLYKRVIRTMKETVYRVQEFSFLICILYVWVSIYIYVCAPSAMPSSHEGQKKESDPLELELQMVLSFDMGDGNQISVLWKRSQFS